MPSSTAVRGIQFVTTQEGKKVAVVIDLKNHGELWQDIYDGLTARRRAREPRYSLQTVRASLRKSGKLRG